MKAFLLLAIASCAAALTESEIESLLDGLAVAPLTDPRFTTSTPPGPNDVRSPCPGLNTLANHGFINHSGKDLTLPDLLVGLAEGMNVAADFTTAIGAVGLLSAPNPFGGSFDLNDLDQHNFPIEHDASLSRQDAYFGNDHSFYMPNWQMVLDHYKGVTQTDILRSAKARYARIENSQAIDPDFVFGLREFVLSYGETALYLQTMGSPLADGVAELSYVNMLFENETLPWELGWRPSLVPITLASLGEQALQVFAALPMAVPEGVNITANSYKDIFEIEVGGAEILANLTGNISKYVGLS